MAKATMYFPPDFKWAAATAAHQVEGNNFNNDWWAWEHTGEHVRGRQKSGLACDWWGAGFDRDMDFAAQLNHNGHRLSIEWSRIEPRECQWDSAAIDRYRYMLKAMRERGIEPMVTLHHFTNPLWVVERGSWETPGIVPLFERYVTKAVDALKDLCDLWVTINEPNVYAVLGWSQEADHLLEFTTPSSDFPPGKNDPQMVFKVVDQMMLAHGAAYHAIHRVQPQARVGLAHHMRLFDPVRSGSPLDQFCAWNRDRLFNRIPLHAVIDGHLDRPIGLARRVRQLKNTAERYFRMGNLVTLNPLHQDYLESWLRRTYPISTLQVRRGQADVFTTNNPLVDDIIGAAGYVNGQMARLRTMSGDTGWLYVGMVDTSGGFMRGATPGLGAWETATPAGVTPYRPVGYPDWDFDGFELGRLVRRARNWACFRAPTCWTHVRR